ncbi:MAG: IS3 family transposase [Clostridia bacterium]|nr:IS3 family transposase [Clostridia bacterium]
MYTLETRNNSLSAYKNGKTAKEICKLFGISRTCLYNWIKRNKIIKDNGSSQKYTYVEVIALHRKIERLEKTKEILQSAFDSLNLTLTKKLEIADNLKEKYQTMDICRTIDINHSTFCNHSKRRKGVTKYEIHDSFLKIHILRIYNESGKRFGAKKILEKLATENIRTSLRKVSLLMRELNIKSKRRNNPIKNTSRPKYFYYKDKLRQNFNQTQPNTFWVGDVTCIKIRDNRYYLCVVMDLFSRKIISYEFSARNSISLVVNTFKKAFELRNNPQGLTFHSDQGPTYTSNQYKSLLKTLKVEQSFSKRGTPYDNSVVEAFFSNLKRDDLHSQQFEYFDDMKYAVKNYIEHYNSYRPHESLGYKTPNQVEREYFSQN